MRVDNAIKALGKFGTVQHVGSQRYIAQRGGWEIQFLVNGRNEPGAEITCVRARRLTDHDESHSDYFAGSFFDTISKAMKWANRMIAEDVGRTGIMNRGW